jgi:hypothetical protein
MTSLYLQLTNKCDQQCAHCFFNCGPWRNEFMSDEVFAAAITLARVTNCDSITLGGGEPSLCPDVLRIFTTVTQELPKATIGIISNGTGDEEVIRELALLVTKTPNAAMVLSNDEYHRNPSPALLDFLQSLECDRVSRRKPFSAFYQSKGRGRDLPPGKVCVGTRCSTETIAIAPDGTLFPCSCGLTWEPGAYADLSVHIVDVLQDSYSITGLYHCTNCCPTPSCYHYWCAHTYPQYVAELRDPEELQTRHTACYCP